MPGIMPMPGGIMPMALFLRIQKNGIVPNRVYHTRATTKSCDFKSHARANFSCDFDQILAFCVRFFSLN